MKKISKPANDNPNYSEAYWLLLHHNVAMGGSK